MTGAARSSGTLLGGLSAITFVAAAVNGHFLTAVLAAAVLWFGANKVVEWTVAAKARPQVEDAQGEVDPELAPVLAELERTRTAYAAEIEQRMHTRLPAGLALGVLGWSALQFSHKGAGPIDLAIFASIGAAGGWAWASGTLAERYRQMYKQAVLPRLAAEFGELTYRTAEKPDTQVLKEQRLFHGFDSALAEDEIAGTLRDVPVSIVELKLEDTSGDTRRTVFDGLLARVTLPRHLSGTTAIVSDPGLLGNLRDSLGSARVRLEDPRFESVYQVYGEQIGARALLTPAFMERFLALGERPDFLKPLALCEDNRLTVALPKCGLDDLFEPPPYSHPAASRATLAKLHDDLAAVVDVLGAVIDLDQFARRAEEKTA